jgi:hypothetical protein
MQKKTCMIFFIQGIFFIFSKVNTMWNFSIQLLFVNPRWAWITCYSQAIDQAHHATLLSWVDKALDQSLSKKNIKLGFKVIEVYPPNPQTMDKRTKSSDLYILAPNATSLRL